MHLVVPISMMNGDRQMRWIVPLQCRIDVPPTDRAILRISRSCQGGKRLLIDGTNNIDGGLTIQVGISFRVVLPHQCQTITCSYRYWLISLLKKRVQCEEDTPGNERREKQHL